MSGHQSKESTPKRRAHRPKVRGCHQCSKRRINCDLTQPNCQKCSDRGLQCSGYGTRYRFNDGVAARGFGKGKTMQQAMQERALQSPAESSCSTSSPPIHEIVTSRMVSGDDDSWMTTPYDLKLQHSNPKTSTNVPIADDAFEIPLDGSGGFFHTRFIDRFHSEEEQVESTNKETYLLSSSSTLCICYESPCVVPPDIQKLLLHFSDHIAFEMMAIDGRHNGFRYLILPMAHQDELIMNAVASVSAFHCAALRKREIVTRNLGWELDLHHPSSYATETAEPMKLYARAISMLRERQELSRQSLEVQRSVMITLLVLLVGIQVTGSDDFPVFHRALEAAFLSVGGEDGLGNDDVRDFVVRQIRKYHVYAAPFIDVETGIQILSSEATRSRAFDCLHYCCEQQIDQAQAAAAIESLNQQSHEIYLRQAKREAPLPLSGLESLVTSNSESIARVQTFKESLERFPRNTAGHQTLIWATFMAASDCILEEHKSFFRDVLYGHYIRSGFGNILTGIAHLEQMWQRRRWGEKWTSSLPQSRVLVS